MTRDSCARGSPPTSSAIPRLSSGCTRNRVESSDLRDTIVRVPGRTPSRVSWISVAKREDASSRDSSSSDSGTRVKLLAEQECNLVEFFLHIQLGTGECACGGEAVELVQWHAKLCQERTTTVLELCPCHGDDGGHVLPPP